MATVAFMDPWVVGTRFFLKRDAVAGIENPVIDHGTIQETSPTVTPSTIQLKDPESGIKVLIDERVTEFLESYDCRFSNLNLDNLSMIYYSPLAASFSQSAVEKTVTHYCHTGRLLKIHDNDAAATPLFSLATVAGVYTGTVLTKAIVGTGAALVASTKTIILTGDQTGVAGLAPGKVIFVNYAGIVTKTNSRSYTIVTRTLNAGNTDLVVLEAIAANETGITGATVTHENSGTIYKQDVDWEVKNNGLVEGLIRFKTGGAFAADGNLSITFATGALSGNRLLLPQSLAQPIQGKGWLWFNRDNHGYKSVREARFSVTPNGSALTSDDYSSITFNLKVLSDLTNANSGGRFLQAYGSLPTVTS